MSGGRSIDEFRRPPAGPGRTALATSMRPRISRSILANRFGIAFDALEVQVDAEVDVRGTLLVDRAVPVGFQKIALCARLSPSETPSPGVIARLMKAAEHSCVVLQTVRNGPDITVRSEVL
ncbi:OsmC family protein [Denitromonas halophila]|uniref:OsmC family protein n=2 Tax=Denitromonas halophila TaxID=1629404 RepID=A0A557R059_9RHOO|nr:OsmC family protein [Denitromonas halophila]